jgi:hypothetical protein
MEDRLMYRYVCARQDRYSAGVWREAATQVFRRLLVYTER